VNQGLVYKCMVKGTTGEDSLPRYSHNWVFARRGFLKIYPDRMCCGDWTIHFTDITRVIRYKTRVFGVPCGVLRIITDGASYQFGYNPWACPEKHLAGLPVEEQTVKLRYSPFSVAYRILLLLGVIVYFVFKYMKQP